MLKLAYTYFNLIVGILRCFQHLDQLSDHRYFKI